MCNEMYLPFIAHGWQLLCETSEAEASGKSPGCVIILDIYSILGGHTARQEMYSDFITMQCNWKPFYEIFKKQQICHKTHAHHPLQ